MSTKVIAFDCEARGLDWFDHDHRAFMYTWADEAGEYMAREGDEEAIREFTDALREADVLVAHNFPYDAHQVRESLGLDVLTLGKQIRDTLMESQVLHPSGQQRVKHGLKDLAQIYLRHDAKAEEDAIAQAAKDIGLRTLKQTGAYYDVDRAYPEMMARYAVMDARHTFDLDSMFMPKASGAEQKIIDLEMSVMPILIRAEAKGVAVDTHVVQRLKAEYYTAQNEVYELLVETLGEDIEGKDLADKLIEAGVPLTRRTPTGTLSTNAYALAQFEDDYEIIGQLQEYRRLTKFLSTYIGALDGRAVVHPSFRQNGAWTGRMSCSRPNLQNFPKRAGKEVRATLIPRPGCAFVVCDYESIEARLLAYYLGDDSYRQLIEDGHDPHAWMAAQIHGGEPADYAKGTPGQPLRDSAKNTTFAIMYGAGGPRVADMLKIPIPDAKSLISQIKGTLPGWWDLQRRVKNKVETLGHVNTIYGRKQMVSREKSYVGLNALIQGSAADIFKLGLVEVASAVEPYGAVPLLFVHDEIVVECPAEAAINVELAMHTAMTQPGVDLGLRPRLSVESSITEESYACA